MAQGKVKGKCKWAYVKNLDTKYEPQWKITIFMDPTEAKRMMEVGFKVHRVDELLNPDLAELGQYRMNCTRKEKKRGKAAGQLNDPPILIDADNEPFEDILGDGSDVIVTYKVYNWTYNGNPGVSPDLEKVKVINLIPYVPKDAEETAPAVVEEPPVTGGSAPAKDDDIPF